MTAVVDYPHLTLAEARGFLVSEYGTFYADRILCDTGFDPRSIGTLIINQLFDLGWKFCR